jgi:hypothetical protein
MFNPQRLIADIDAVFLQFPDLAEDEELKRYVIEHGTDFKPALEACLAAMREAESLAEGIYGRIKTLDDRANRMERKADAMRALMQKILEHAQASKFVLPEATLSLRQIPPSVVIADEAQIPVDYLRIKSEPDKTAIKKALLDGVEVPGACLSNGGISLSVRTK